MTQFNLEKHLKNPTRPIVTRYGRSVRIICTDKKSGSFPVVGLIEGVHIENIAEYTKDGEYSPGIANSRDLFFAPEKKTGWINIYRIGSMASPGPMTYNTEEEAKSARDGRLDCISTIKIEWEE